MKDITSTITKPLAALGENGGTIFVVNAMPAENAKRTQEELVKALIAKEAMALQEADVA